MTSWYQVPKITYPVENFSKHSCVLQLQFKQIVNAHGPLVSFSLTCDPLGVKISKRYYKLQQKVFKLS